jgi:hypothetical protein
MSNAIDFINFRMFHVYVAKLHIHLIFPQVHILEASQPSVKLEKQNF